MSEHGNEMAKNNLQGSVARRLQAGERAPQFKGENPQGRLISSAEFRGKLTWLALFRYAACPFCNWRIHRLVREQDRIKAAGLNLLAVFPSPAARVTAYIERYKPNFVVIADPGEVIYKVYHSETNWVHGLLTAVNVPKVIRAVVHSPNNPFAIDGAFNRMPAEFLIDREQHIAMARYGTSPDDGIEVDAAIGWASACKG